MSTSEHERGLPSDGYLLEIAGESDRRRILLQNRGRRLEDGGIDYGKAEWGQRHLHYMQFLKDQGIAPKEIAEIGVADDARLVENIYRVFPDAHITVFEIDPVRLEKARETLVTIFGETDISQRVSFVAGDAAVTLPSKEKRFGMVDYQLLDEHLTDYQLGAILHAVSQTLQPDGVMTTADLDFGVWYTRVDPKYKGEPLIEDLSNETNKTIMSVRRDVYGKLGRHAWASAIEHAQKIQELSNNTFRYDQALSFPPQMLEFSKNDLEVDLMNGITEIFGKYVPELQPQLNAYIAGLREGKLIGAYPALFHQTFQFRK